jgi:hypothetical protein
MPLETKCFPLSCGSQLILTNKPEPGPQAMIKWWIIAHGVPPGRLMEGATGRPSWVRVTGRLSRHGVLRRSFSGDDQRLNDRPSVREVTPGFTAARRGRVLQAA